VEAAAGTADYPDHFEFATNALVALIRTDTDLATSTFEGLPDHLRSRHLNTFIDQLIATSPKIATDVFFTSFDGRNWSRGETTMGSFMEQLGQRDPGLARSALDKVPVAYQRSAHEGLAAGWAR